MKKRVVIGMSGGVDSSVAALLLKQQGFDVVSLFMRNWNDSTGVLTGSCSWEDDVFFAEAVSQKLGIPFNFVDLSDQYRKRVVDYMFAEYEKGRTPNPDVLCNREIKFDVFLDECLKLGADYVATGHYCQKNTIIKNNQEIHQLIAGKDGNKDQSYFLCQLSQQQLAKALFPIGHLLKPEVRKIAADNRLMTATRKDSQGICFIGKVDLPTFLQQQLTAKDGDIIEIHNYYYKKQSLRISEHPNHDELEKLTEKINYTKYDGIKIGKHRGAQFFTIGQRKGLKIGGRKEPMFVIATDVKSNIVFVGEGENHQGLYRKGLFIRKDEIHWIRKDLTLVTGEKCSYLVRIRYRQPLQKATLFQEEDGLYIIFEEMQRGISSGQFAAWYDNDELIGSGVIF